MTGEITPLDKIKIGANLAVQTGKPITTNPYPQGHVAHDMWEKYYCAFALMSNSEKRVCGAHPEHGAPYGVAP